MSSPNETPPKPPSWIPAWMGDRERAGLIIAVGLLCAAFITVCGGFCAGLIQSQMFRLIR